MSTNGTKRMKHYLAEMFLIIMSVLLAFFLNEMRNNHLQRKKLITSLQFIQEEISQNQRYVREYIDVHETIINKIDSLIQFNAYNSTYTPESGFAFYLIHNKSYFNQLLSSEAWNIAYSNNIFDEMNMGDVVTISRAYEQQKYVMKTVWEISDFLQSESVFDQKQTKVNCQILQNRFNTLHGLEVRLNLNYEEAIKVLNKFIN